MPGPWEDYTPAPDVASMVAAEAKAQGVDPDFAVRVANQESRLNHGQVSPAGAIGVMQLMPDTAKELGVDPSDLGQNIRGGVSYLKQQIDTFKDPRLAAAAYNAGPGAVQKYGGVPPYKETQAYVDAVAPGGAAQPPWMDYGSAPATDAAPVAPVLPTATASPPVLRSHNGGVTIGLAGPDDAPAATKTSTPADMVHGYLSGLGGSMAQTADSVANFIPGLGGIDRLLSTGSIRQALAPDPLHMIGGLAQKLLQRRGGDYAPQTVPGQYAKAVGQYTPAAAMPGSIPARVANVVIPALASEGAGQATKAAGGSPALQSAARIAGGIAGGGVASLRLNPGAARAPNILDAVRAARRAAYADVESAGAVIPQPAMQDLAQNVTDLVRTTAGPDGAAAYPAAHAMASRLSSMAASPDGVTLPQLDTLRSDIFDAMVKGGDREAPVGVAMRDHIDHAIAGTGDTNILRARDLYTRERQIQTIQDELESARLRTASTNSGQNGNNAIRQELRPLIDPTRNQQITNFPPDVLQAMNRAVTGSGPQNALRDASNMLRNRFLQGAAGLATKGVAMIPMEIGGRMLNNAAENGTVRNVQRVIDMIARGTPTSAAPAITAPRAPPLLSAPDTNPALLASLISLIPAASAAKAQPPQRPPQRR